MTCSAAHLLAAGQATIPRERLHIKKHIPPLDSVAVAVVNDSLDGRHHVVNVLRCAGLQRWTLTAKGVHVLMKLFNVA